MQESEMTEQVSSGYGPELKEHFAPQREAAFFYGLFLRGHSASELRRDIGVPREVLARWSKLWRHEPLTGRRHQDMLAYRRQVLAIFDGLVRFDQATSHLRQ